MRLLALAVTLLVALVHCQPNKVGNSHDDILNINSKMFAKKATAAFTATTRNIKEEDMLEGDIVMNLKLKKFLNNQRDGKKTSQFDAAVRSAWPGARVPYTFARGFRYTSAVRQAISEYNAKTCIRFVPRKSSDRSYVEFFHGGGCYSMIGRQGGRQQVSLGNGCGTKGVAIHEMMHALGFFHEQSRRDRDGYIRIMWNNIPGRVRYNFEKYRHGQADTLNEKYDKQSIMHYGNYAFSTNGRKTIVSISNPNEALGQRNGLSRIDINQLKKMYKCGGVTPTSKPTSKPTTCTDRYQLCPTLARERLCNVSVSRWVKTNCKKSCGECKTKPSLPKCNSDRRTKHCNSWNQSGYCRGKFGDWMGKHCPQCKKCQK